VTEGSSHNDSNIFNSHPRQYHSFESRDTSEGTVADTQSSYEYLQHNENSQNRHSNFVVVRNGYRPRQHGKNFPRPFFPQSWTDIGDEGEPTKNSEQRSSLFESQSVEYEPLDPRRNSVVKESFRNSGEESAENRMVKCTSCSQNDQMESSLPQTTLRAMRLELIKQQILRKLRLKEPPNAKDIPTGSLPPPLALETVLYKKSTKNMDRNLDDFYSKTEQVIVFPEEGTFY